MACTTGKTQQTRLSSTKQTEHFNLLIRAQDWLQSAQRWRTTQVTQHTWECEYEEACESSEQRDDDANVRHDNGQKQWGREPYRCHHDASTPFLTCDLLGLQVPQFNPHTVQCGSVKHHSSVQRLITSVVKSCYRLFLKSVSVFKNSLPQLIMVKLRLLW